MSEQSNVEPTEPDLTSLEHVEDGPRAEYELADVDPTLDEAQRETRIDGTEGDDLPYSPPDLQPRATEREMAGLQGEETIEERIAQEEPDPTSAYGAPDDEGGLDAADRLGGDDALSIPVDQDFVGAPEGVAGGVEDDPSIPAEEAGLHIEDDPTV